MGTKIQASRTVKFISKAGTYTALLQSDRGQLWQSYQGDASSPANIIPNFQSIKPLLLFVVVSSRTSGASAVAGTPKWYFGSAQINTSNINAIDSAYSDYFELVSPSNGQNYYGLRIKKNLVALAQGTSVTIKAVGTVAGANFSDEIQAEHTINIYPQTGNSAQIDIIDVTSYTLNGVSMTGRNFTFTEENQNIQLKCETYIGSQRVDSSAAQITANAITYQWQRIQNGAWANISGATSQTLTVNENDVMTYAKYRCEVKQNGSLLGYGKANLMDSTDPYIINPNPSPEDETIEDVGDTVVYTPKVVTRGNLTTVATGFSSMKFNFVFTASDGVTIGTTTNSSTGTVTYQMCANYGNIEVSIETVDDVSDY